MEKSIQFQG